MSCCWFRGAPGGASFEARRGGWTRTSTRRAAIRPRNDAAGAALVAYLGAHAARLLRYDPAYASPSHDDDSVHKIGWRRADPQRTAYTRAAPLRGRTRGARDQLKWLTDALGEVRDIEVIQVHLHTRSVSCPAPPDRLAPGDAAAERRPARAARTLLTDATSGC